MNEQLYILLMKDRWNAEDFAEYERLTAKTTTQAQKPIEYNIGDTRTDSAGTWQKTDVDTWALIG